MKKKIITIAIYLSGCLVTYQGIKHHTEKKFNKWTVGDRCFAIAFSSLSWLSAFGVMVTDAGDYIDFNQSAKW